MVSTISTPMKYIIAIFKLPSKYNTTNQDMSTLPAQFFSELKQFFLLYTLYTHMNKTTEGFLYPF